MGARFGTDGLRGVANADLSPELVLAFGRAVARLLPCRAVLIGRDTRRSGPLLQAALAAGLSSEGTDVVDCGVLPTPALAWLATDRGSPAAMISASHNPFGDNGIKVLRSDGTKLPDETEWELEAELERILAGSAGGGAAVGAAGGAAVGAAVGVVEAEPDALGGYIDHVVGSIEGRALGRFKVVLDCACGAASSVAPRVFERLGASVLTMAAEPNGVNINDGCGSTHPEGLQRAVVDAGADLGLAFDGDADRVLAVDHAGALIDGDVLLSLFAGDLAGRGLLEDDSVVVTVLTNQGFRLAMADRGISVHETKVGDRHVLEALERDGLSLGGEQSGHIIFRRLATTGDGVLTGVQLMDLLERSGRSLREAAKTAMVRLPQELVSVPVSDPQALEAAGPVWDEVAKVAAELGEGGRVLLRPSGTEPVVRVMVEAPTEDDARGAARRLSAVVERELGASS